MDDDQVPSHFPHMPPGAPRFHDPALPAEVFEPWQLELIVRTIRRLSDIIGAQNHITRKSLTAFNARMGALAAQLQEYVDAGRNRRMELPELLDCYMLLKKIDIWYFRKNHHLPGAESDMRHDIKDAVSALGGIKRLMERF